MMENPIKDNRVILLRPSAFLTSLGIGIINLGMLFVVKDVYKAEAGPLGWFAAIGIVAQIMSLKSIGHVEQ